MRFRLPALLAALTLAASPAMAKVYYGNGGNVADGGQTEFLSKYNPDGIFDPAKAAGTTGFSQWSVVFACSGPELNAATNSCPQGNPVTIGGATFENTLTPATQTATLSIIPGNTLATPPGFDILTTNPNAFLEGATLTATFSAADAVGFMLAQGSFKGMPVIIFTLGDGKTVVVDDKEFFGLTGLVFIGLDGVGSITGVTITVPGATDRDMHQHFVALGPMQFGIAKVDAPVPEPASMLVLGAGLLGLGLARRRR